MNWVQSEVIGDEALPVADRVRDGTPFSSVEAQ